jgi:glycosyltransferase involved in cell wall biosynthesis
MTERLKVLFLAQNLTTGGAEELLLLLATHLPAERFEIVVGCLSHEGIIAHELRQAGVRVELMAGEPGPRDPRAFWRLVRFIRLVRPDVVHTFLLNAGLYGRLAAWLAGVPTIYHAEQNIYERKPRRHLLLERFLGARTTRVIACCHAVGDFYQRQVGLDSRRLEVIYNSVDFASLEPRTERPAARAELGYEPKHIVLGCVGRLTEQKAQDVLLNALARLIERLPELRLFMAGEGRSRASLERQVSSLGLGDRVRFLGLRRDRGTLYSAMDVFVLPSRWEGLSLALVEAAGLGLPLVATNVGGNAEVVQPGPGVWLVPPEDTSSLEQALAEAAVVVGDRPGEMQHPLFVRHAVRERFGLDRHLGLLEASYRWALGLPAPDGAPLSSTSR